MMMVFFHFFVFVACLHAVDSRRLRRNSNSLLVSQSALPQVGDILIGVETKTKFKVLGELGSDGGYNGAIYKAEIEIPTGVHAQPKKVVIKVAQEIHKPKFPVSPSPFEMSQWELDYMEKVKKMCKAQELTNECCNHLLILDDYSMSDHMDEGVRIRPDILLDLE